MSPFGNGLLQSLRTGGIQEMDREGGAMVPNQTPPPRSRRHVGDQFHVINPLDIMIV